MVAILHTGTHIREVFYCRRHDPTRKKILDPKVSAFRPWPEMYPNAQIRRL